MCTPGCNDNADCGGGTPTCDIVNNACAVCVNNVPGAAADNGCGDADAPICVTLGAASQPPAGQGGLSCSACVDDSANPTAPATGCNPQKPLCDTRGTPECVGCKSDIDCTGSMPVCDLVSQNCTVECVNDNDCDDLSAPACDVSDGGGVCVACTSDANCTGAASICNIETNTCVIECSSNADCGGAKPVCRPGGGLCVECAVAADCPAATPVCDTRSFSCVGCTTDADCGGGATCNINTRRCEPEVSCTDNADCGGATPICDAGRQMCVGCVSDNDCAANEICRLATQTCRAPVTAGLSLTGGSCALTPARRIAGGLWIGFSLFFASLIRRRYR